MNILSEINRMAKTDPVGLIGQAERRYDLDLAALAEKITANEQKKIILLAGSSGSGKTTTAHILRDKLKTHGVFAEVVSLDHFYLPVDQMPRLANGDPDFESVYSLDIPAIRRCFSEIIASGKTDMPTFDFTRARRGEQPLSIDIGSHGLLIIEGLHALNPVLTGDLHEENLFRLYISVNCPVVDDEGGVVLTSRQMRLIRRMSRDAIYRNTTAERTLKLWTSVVAGEEKYLYCFTGTADHKLITFHSFEPCVFRNIVTGLLENLPQSAENYDYVMKTKSALERFVPLDFELVPESSLIREFIKGGVYENQK